MDASNTTDLDSQQWIDKVHPGNRVRVYVETINDWPHGVVRRCQITF